MTSGAESRAPVSVIIPTFRRTKRLLDTLERIASCSPAPREILVQIDFGDEETAAALAKWFPSVIAMRSDTPLGPGGARNRLMRIAREELVASFDDDSYPLDKDFFKALVDRFSEFPDAGVLATTIIHDGEAEAARTDVGTQTADFVGCGCAYRRQAFLATRGYLPLTLAYGMEEADLSLQILDRGWRILHCADLRVRHATRRAHQASAAVTSAHIRNTALLAFLRYPVAEWPYGMLQTANRVVWSIRHGRAAGVVSGITSIPPYLWKHRRARAPIAMKTLNISRSLRKDRQRAIPQ